MMLIIMCDLKSFDNAATLSEAVASLGPSIHFLKSFWLLSTDKSFAHVQNTLRTRVGFRADVSITEIAHKHAYHLPNEANDWLATHRRRET
jgi:hypothetical protein